MSKCSQCGKQVPFYERDMFTGTCNECRKAGVRPGTLGCGTLILIGLVVALVTNSGFDNVAGRLRAIEHEVDQLQAEVARQTTEIQLLRKIIEESRAPSAARAR